MGRNVVSIDGLKELEAALAALPKATGKNVLKRVLLARGEPIAAMARGMAPDDPRTGGRDLHSSIGVGTKLSKRQAGLHKKMFRDDRAAVEVFVGAGPLPQAHLMEFGWVNGAPQPYMRPAWDAGQDVALGGIAEDLWTEISKAAARLARKTARLAARQSGGV